MFIMISVGASSAPLVIEQNPISVDLGNDFTTCASQDFTLNAQVVKSTYSSIDDFSYKLTIDNDPPISQTTSDFSITGGLSAGLHTCLVEVWLDDGGSTFPDVLLQQM
ncbi:MAG: hypothetical protein IPO63_07705 [Bacteroidetes bacterium]|nr:hypothetical protein [Bacteroidota bacterium]